MLNSKEEVNFSFPTKEIDKKMEEEKSKVSTKEKESQKKFWETPLEYMKVTLFPDEVENITKAIKRFYERQNPETQKWLDEIKDSKRAYQIFYVLEQLDKTVLKWDVLYKLDLSFSDNQKQEEMKDKIEQEKKGSAKLVKEYLETQYGV